MTILSLIIYYVFGAWDYALLIFGLAFAVGIAIVIYNDGDSVEKDRILVTYLAFLIVIIFWGAFEQAGGLMNIYAKQKTDLSLFGFFDVPASWFQSVNAIFIIIFATLVGSFWVWWKNKGNEYSSIFKMAIGVIIMGWGFFFMSIASSEVVYDSNVPQISITFNSRPGAIYAIDFSTNLEDIDSDGGWAELDDGVFSEGKETTFIDEFIVGSDRKVFYRVREVE